MYHALAAATEEGGGVQVNVGIIALVAVAILAAVVLFRRRL